MKWRLRFFFVFLLSVANAAYAQAPRDFKSEAAQLIKILDQNHYQLPVLDNSFSEEILETLLNQLDPGHNYFNEKDIQSLGQFRNSLDDEWRGSHWDFLQRLTDTYRNALTRGGMYRSKEIEQPISWEVSEVFIPEGRKVEWSKNEAEERKRWSLWIKYNVLSQIRDGVDSASAKKGLVFVRAHEREMKEHIGVAETRRTKRILQNPNGFENYLAALYFRTVAGYYDPHSLYLSPQEFENFKAAISTKEYSFGLGLNEDQDGNVFIEYLIPGGPAWKSGELHQGDVLIEFRWEGQSPFDLSGIGLDELTDVLDRSNPSALELTVRQSKGLRKTVRLHKEKIETEENTVKGFILTGIKKIGYLSLPGFYTRWGEDESSSCANDVAAEIIKLKREGIDGVILDIRSNGGGSLKEAVDMAGIFIDEGPLVMMTDKVGRIVTLKDSNRGTVYDGPLVILINGQSASASEILAAALQDYHRGIVVGGASFGKATGQVVFSLDPGNHQPSTIQPNQSSAFGYATVTLNRLYRVTGKSNQGSGVLPDVRLPDLYEGAVFHERARPHAFPNDSVVKKAFFRPLSSLPLPELNEMSQERSRRLPAFKKIAALQLQLAEEERASSQPALLRWENFLTGDGPSSVGTRNKPSLLYEVSSPEFNRTRIEMDSYLKEFTGLWMTKLKEDPYVEEAFRIACDYIQLKAKK
jgi:carboxyl-terminal processing protease